MNKADFVKVVPERELGADLEINLGHPCQYDA